MDEASLIQNPSPLFIFYNYFPIFELRAVLVHRKRSRTGISRHKNEPSPFVFGEAQKIRLPIDLKIHFDSSKKPALMSVKVLSS